MSSVPRFPRHVLPLVLGLLLATGTAAAWRFPWSKPATGLAAGKSETYPATYAAPVTASIDVARLDLLFAQTEIVSYMAHRYYPKAGSAAPLAYLTRSHRWSEVPIPPRVADVMRGVRLYIFIGPDWLSGGFAVREDRAYLLPGEINQLLYDCGVKFRDQDVPAWIRALVFVYSATENIPYGADIRLQADSVMTGLQLLFESYTIERLEADTAGPSGRFDMVVDGHVGRVRFGLRIGTRFERVEVETYGGFAPDRRVMPYRLHSSSGVWEEYDQLEISLDINHDTEILVDTAPDLVYGAYESKVLGASAREHGAPRGRTLALARLTLRAVCATLCTHGPVAQLVRAADS